MLSSAYRTVLLKVSDRSFSVKAFATGDYPKHDEPVTALLRARQREPPLHLVAHGSERSCARSPPPNFSAPGLCPIPQRLKCPDADKMHTNRQSPTVSTWCLKNRRVQTMRSVCSVLLLGLLSMVDALAQDAPRIFQFEGLLDRACPCPPGQVLATPLVDQAMILPPDPRFRPKMRTFRPAPGLRPHFRNLACRPLRPPAWLDSLQTKGLSLRSGERKRLLRFHFPEPQSRRYARRSM